MAIELVKENIEYEQSLGENTADSVMKAEYVIPDTHPDVAEILMVDAKPSIITCEVMQDKVFLDGQVLYNVLYCSKEDKGMVFNATYTGKFSNYIEIQGAAHKMSCDTECFVEHMECSIVNERKIALEGIIKLKAQVTKNYQFDIVKDVKGAADVQLLKNPASVDKIVGSVPGELIGKSHMEVPMDAPQIGHVLKCDVNVHKRDVKILESKIQLEAFLNMQVLYRGKDNRELGHLMDDVLIRQELDLPGANSFMNHFTDFAVDTVETSVKDNDLGESRILDIEALIKTNTKVLWKENIDMIEDAYSPQMVMEMSKKNYELNTVHGSAATETVVKENIGMNREMAKPQSIIYGAGRVSITDKRIVEDKIVMDGLLNVDVLFRTADEDMPVSTVREEIPFTCGAEIPGCKIDMHSQAKVSLENLEFSIEAGTIAVKALIIGTACASYVSHKEFLVDIQPVEGEVPRKKASITIYVVQPGDTLWKVAKRYFTTIDNLIKINSIDDPDNLTAGLKLIIPGRAVI